MKKTLLLSGLLTTALVMACAGDDGKDTGATGNQTGASATATTSGASASATESDSATSTGGTGSASMGTSTGDATGTSAATDSTGATTCSFVDCNTTGATDVQCDIWNDDCPDGQKCMPWANDGGGSWNATKCSPLDPAPGKPGDPCTVEGSGVSGIDSCEKGSMCWNVDGETMMGYCVGFCDGSPESFSCAEQGTFCTIVNNGVLILCLPGCDPLLQDCPNGDLCIYGGEGFICVLDASGEEGQYGDPCEFANVCDPGLVCLNPEYVPDCQAGGCCSPFCELDVDYETIPAPAANCPDPAMACLNWFEAGMAPPGQEKVGVCGIPQ